MITRNSVKTFLLFVFLGCLSVTEGIGCSMFKITLYGKTMVGNNEDFWNPNTYMWTEQGKNQEYGAIYFGYENFWPQGGINQAGLAFDGFAEEYLAIRDTLGKLPLKSDFIKEIMKTCASVDQVRIYLKLYNLSGLERGMLFFVDKTGKYLIVEGDSLIIGTREYYTLSNFYPSLTPDENKVPIAFYQKGRKLLESRRDTSISFCSSVSDTMRQEKEWGGGTMYTTIYDLNEGIIYLYHFRDFDHVLKFDINLELEKNNYTRFIPDLFPENKTAQDYLNNYNSIHKELEQLKDESIIKDSSLISQITNNLLLQHKGLISKFSDVIFEIGNSWTNKNEYSLAVAVFRIGVVLNPDTWTAYAILADAYMRTTQFELALFNYERAVSLNPDFTDGRKQIEMLKSK